MPSGRNFSPPGTPSKAAAAEVAALHAIHEEEQLLFVTQLPEAKQILWGRGRNTALALDAFDHDGRGRGGQGGAHGIKVIVWHLPKARHHRLKALLDLFLAGGGNAGQRSAVKGVFGCDDFEPALIVAELAGQLEQAFVGLDTAVAEEAFSRANEPDERLPQPPLRLMVIEI
jgi:hypothetical protein